MRQSAHQGLLAGLESGGGAPSIAETATLAELHCRFRVVIPASSQCKPVQVRALELDRAIGSERLLALIVKLTATDSKLTDTHSARPRLAATNVCVEQRLHAVCRAPVLVAQAAGSGLVPTAVVVHVLVAAAAPLPPFV